MAGKGNPNFKGKPRGEFFINVTKDDKKGCEEFVKVWNAKPDVHKDKLNKAGEPQRYTLMEYVKQGSFDKWVKLPDSDETIAKKVLPSLRAKANELRELKYPVKMREAAEKLQLNPLGRRNFVIAWESSKDLEEVANKMIAKGSVKGDYSDKDKKKSLLQSLRYTAKSMMKEGLSLKTDFYEVNIRISDDDFIEYFNANTSWGTLLASLQEDGLCSQDKKIAALKMQKDRIEKDAKEGKKDSPFTATYAARSKIKDEIPDLKKLLESLKGGVTVDLEESKDDDSEDADDEEEEEEEEEGEVSEEETVTDDDPFEG